MWNETLVIVHPRTDEEENEYIVKILDYLDEGHTEGKGYDIIYYKCTDDDKERKYLAFYRKRIKGYDIEFDLKNIIRSIIGDKNIYKEDIDRLWRIININDQNDVYDEGYAYLPATIEIKINKGYE